MSEKATDTRQPDTSQAQDGLQNDIKKPRRFTEHKLFRQGIRYLIVGFSSLAIELLLFSLLYEVLGVFVVVSNVVSITCASTYNFYMSRTWTFQSSSNLLRSVILYLLLFCWNQVFSSWAILMLMDMDINAIIAKAVTMAAIVCWNFVLYRKVVFV